VVVEEMKGPKYRSTDRAETMITALRLGGWTVRTFDEDALRIYVDGTDQYGDRFTGRVHRHSGALEAEPVG
jgi:hypothetical protein